MARLQASADDHAVITWPQGGTLPPGDHPAGASRGDIHRFLNRSPSLRGSASRFPQIFVPEEGTVRPFWWMLTR
jgi:hypothetical protein